MHKKYLSLIIPICALLAFLASCQGSASLPTNQSNQAYITTSPSREDPAATEKPTGVSESIKIKGRTIMVDKVVEGFLCNDTWSGIVYVTENIQVNSWTETPLFLTGCNLVIAPGTVVYVAHHNDTAYYNGCSCHIGSTSNP